MQKLVYVSNSRDYNEQGNINENKYFKEINGLLKQGWNISNITPNSVTILDTTKADGKETFAAFVLLEKHEGESAQS